MDTTVFIHRELLPEKNPKGSRHVSEANDAFQTAQAILKGLKNGQGLKPDQLQVPERTDEMADGAAWVRVHHQWVPTRLRYALLADGAAVQLLSEGTLEWAEAERILATKEEKRVFAALREPVWNHAQIAYGANVSDAFQELKHDENVQDCPRHPTQTAALATCLLKKLDAYTEAAIDVLAASSQDPLNQTMAWERALDGSGWFGMPHDSLLRAYLRPTLEATENDTMELKRVRVPRSMAGEVFQTDRGQFRIGVCPTFRYRRFLTCLKGCYEGLAMALCESKGPSTGRQWRSSVLGEALFLSALNTEPLNALTHLSDAHSVMRTIKSLVLLQTRSLAALCHHWDSHHGEMAAISEHLSELFGCVVPQQSAAFGFPRWPGWGRPQGCVQEHERALWSRLCGAHWAHKQRDQYDQRWLWRSEAFMESDLLTHDMEGFPSVTEVKSSEHGNHDDGMELSPAVHDWIDGFLEWFSESF